MTFKELTESERPVLVDFFADWCGPCKAFAPVLDTLKSDLGDAVQIVKINVDKNQELAAKLSVRSIPTVMIYQNGEQKYRGKGSMTLAAMKEELGKLMGEEK